MALFGRKKPAGSAGPAPVADEPLEHRSLAEQRERLLAGVEPLRPFAMGIGEAAGLVLCEDIAADLDLPLVTTAAVDGYGLRAANIVGADPVHPIDLEIVGVVDATDPLPTQAVPPGGCVLLQAGAPCPRGVDAVVALSDAQQAARRVTFTAEVPLHRHLRLRGSELADGTPLLAAGHRLDARSVAVLAEIGLDKVLVRPRPRVVVMSVGADLVEPGGDLTGVHQRYAVATPLIAAAVRDAGATVYPLELLDRNAEAVRAAVLDQAIRADLIVVLTASEVDGHLVCDQLEQLGDVDRAHVALNAGGVQAVGRIGAERTPVVVLPAAPVSAYAAHLLLLAPLLARLAALPEPEPPMGRARLTRDVPPPASGELFWPAALDADGLDPLGGGQEFAHALFRADALAVVTPDAYAAGTEVSYLPLHP